MAYGTELLLVLDRKTIEQYMDPELTLEERAALDYYEVAENVSSEIALALIEAHKQLVIARLDSQAAFGTGFNDRYDLNFKPTGETKSRRISGFSIGEVSDEGEGVVFGISLVSRYAPVWVDWRQKNGGSGAPIILDAEAMRMIDLARQAIAPIIPEILTAPLAVALGHY